MAAFSCADTELESIIKVTSVGGELDINFRSDVLVKAIFWLEKHRFHPIHQSKHTLPCITIYQGFEKKNFSMFNQNQWLLFQEYLMQDNSAWLFKILYADSHHQCVCKAT